MVAERKTSQGIIAVASPVVGICFKQRVVKNINVIVIHE